MSSHRFSMFYLVIKSLYYYMFYLLNLIAVDLTDSQKYKICQGTEAEGGPTGCSLSCSEPWVITDRTRLPRRRSQTFQRPMVRLQRERCHRAYWSPRTNRSWCPAHDMPDMPKLPNDTMKALLPLQQHSAFFHSLRCPKVAIGLCSRLLIGPLLDRRGFQLQHASTDPTTSRKKACAQ